MQGSSDETANSGEDGSSGPGSSSGHSDGSSNEANSSHASQSAGSPGSEVQSEDIADIEALKEEDDEEEEDRSHNAQKSSRSTDLRGRKLESQTGICLGDAPGPAERSGASNGASKEHVFNADTVPPVDNRIRMLDACSHAEDAEQDMTGEMSTAHISQGSQDSCITHTGDFLGETIGNELFNCRQFIGPQHHHHHHHHHHDG